jgi:hypothetical protein
LSLVLAVPVYWIAGGHVGAFIHQPIRQDNQDNFEDEPRSPIQIRPPPLLPLRSKVSYTKTNY